MTHMLRMHRPYRPVLRLTQTTCEAQVAASRLGVGSTTNSTAAAAKSAAAAAVVEVHAPRPPC